MDPNLYPLAYSMCKRRWFPQSLLFCQMLWYYRCYPYPRFPLVPKWAPGLTEWAAMGVYRQYNWPCSPSYVMELSGTCCFPLARISLIKDRTQTTHLAKLQAVILGPDALANKQPHIHIYYKLPLPRSRSLQGKEPLKSLTSDIKYKSNINQI